MSQELSLNRKSKNPSTDRAKTSPSSQRFPLFDRISYAKTDFPLLESITGGRSPDRRLRRLVSLANTTSHVRSNRRNNHSSSTPQNQSILWSPSKQHRTWTSHLWLSYVAEKPPSPPSELHHPEWVSVFSPEESCLHRPIKPIKNKDFFKKFLRRKVKVYIAPNQITPDPTWARVGPSEDAGEPPHVSFDHVYDEFPEPLRDPSILRSMSQEDHEDIAAQVECLGEQQVAIAKDEWTALILAVRKAASSINEEDLRWLDSVRIPNDITIAMVGYVCVLFGIAPRWTQTKRSLLNDIPTFLEFLQKVGQFLQSRN